MSHFNYNSQLWNEYCRVANSTSEIDITRKPRFEVIVQYPAEPEKKPEKQEIILISSKIIIMNEIVYEVDKKDNFEKVPGIRIGCDGLWINIGTIEEPKSHMVVTHLFAKEPEHKITSDCIIYFWKLG